MSDRRTACVILFPGVEELDALGPYETFVLAGRAGAPLSTSLVALDPASPITCAMGAEVHPQGPIPDCPDILVVPGGGWFSDPPSGARAAAADGALPAAVARCHARGSVVASVCTGAFIVARSGIADGRPLTTHHAALDDLRERAVEVRRARVVDDGDLVSAGGITSGIDLALHLVRRQFGDAVAAHVEDVLEYRPSARAYDPGAA